MKKQQIQKVDISIVLPCYNEEKNIFKNVEKIIKKMDKTYKGEKTYEILLVNDGSSDNTELEILKLSKLYSFVLPISYGLNKGKGFAVKYGVSKTVGDIIAFIDSDGDIGADYLIKYINYLIENKETSLVIGNKSLGESNVKRSLKRKILSFVSKIINYGLFSLPFSDTQVGLKVFRAPIRDIMIKKIFTYGYAFDVEFLFFTKFKKFKIDELPISLTINDRQSSIRFYDMLEMLYDLFQLFKRINFIYRFNKKTIGFSTKVKLLFLKGSIYPVEKGTKMLLKSLKNERRDS